MENKRKDYEDYTITDYNNTYNKKIKLYNVEEYIEELVKQSNEHKTIIANLIEKIKEQNYIITNLIEQIEEKKSIIDNITKQKDNKYDNHNKYNLYT